MATITELKLIEANILERAKASKQRTAEEKARHSMETQENQTRKQNGLPRTPVLKRPSHEDWLGTLSDDDLKQFVKLVRTELS